VLRQIPETIAHKDGFHRIVQGVHRRHDRSRHHGLLSEHRAIQAGCAVLLFYYGVAIYIRSAAISQRLRPQRTRRAFQ
jgi:hypothetical protein